MTPRRILQFLSALLVSALLGVGGWYLWTLRRQQQATAQRLQQTQTSLTTTQQTLAQTEEERRELLSAYDELKGRLAKADEDLTQLTRTSTQMTTQLATLTSDRTKLTRQLDEMAQQAEQLDTQIETLEAEAVAVEAERASLERHLQEVTSTSLSPAEVQQLTQAVARAQAEASRRREQLAMLSRAYEQAVQAPSPKAAKGSQPPSSSEAQRTASRYRRLGDTYLATYQYPKAADAYEQALRFTDDPDTHTKLAFLYSRLLHNPTQAQRHLAQAATRDPTSTTLRVTPGAQGLPRKSWQLLWSWLTQ